MCVCRTGSAAPRAGRNTESTPRRPGRDRVFENLLATLGESPLLLVGAAFILAFLGYALLKKLLKIALFVAVFLAIYAGLVYYFG